jgi:hypothetical protein
MRQARSDADSLSETDGTPAAYTHDAVGVGQLSMLGCFVCEVSRCVYGRLQERARGLDRCTLEDCG